MEFKKPNRYNQRRSRLSVPRQDRPDRPTFLPSASSDKVDATQTPSKQNRLRALLRLKLAFIPHLERFSFNKKTIVIVVTIVSCVVIGLLVHNSAAATKPDYQTILPGKKPIDNLGGWKRISPPGNDPVFAYADTIDDISISVSQQPLPQSFKDDATNQVAELAKRFNATDKIDTGSIAVYVGTSSKGPQSVIFTKDNLLILIKSQKKVNNTSWAKYAESLN